MGSSVKSERSGRRSAPDPWKLVFRISVIIGWIVAVIGVAIFTYSEAYPRVGHRMVGDLTLSQFGFWLMVIGIGLVVLAVIASQARAVIVAKQFDTAEVTPPVNASFGTGVEGGGNIVQEDEPTAPLLGSTSINYGLNGNNKSGPFSLTRSARVVTPTGSSSSKKGIP